MQLKPYKYNSIMTTEGTEALGI